MSLLGFELLPALSEGEEFTSLSDILITRDTCLVEEELWAVCNECCIALQNTENSSDVFREIHISPDSLAIDDAGGVCFLHIIAEEDSVYRHSQWEKMVDLAKGHLFSLGVTLLYAAEYNMADETIHAESLSASLESLLNALTSDDVTLIPDLNHVLAESKLHLSPLGCSSGDICRQLVAPLWSGRSAITPRRFLDSHYHGDSSSLSPSPKSSPTTDGCGDQEDLITSQGETTSPTPSTSPAPSTFPKPSASPAPCASPPSGSRTPASGSRTTASGSRTPASGSRTTASGSRTPASGSRTPASSGSRTPASGSRTPVSDSHTSASSGSRTPASSGSRTPASSGSRTPASDWEARSENVGSPGHTRSQSVLELLTKIGVGLLENELWALCRECTLALRRRHQDLPAYISLETVVMEEDGTVSFRAAPDHKDLEALYLAPELEHRSVVTEKTCLFGVAAMLWSAADYNMPQDQEPALSEAFENLLMSMTQNAPDLRPSAHEVLQVCNDFQDNQDISSDVVCKTLVADAHASVIFGDENTLGKDEMKEEIKVRLNAHHVALLHSIRQSALQLKPASERRLAEKCDTDSLHSQLMKDLRQPPKKLRKSSHPKTFAVGDMYRSNPELIRTLARVTKRNTKPAHDSSAFIHVTTVQGQEGREDADLKTASDSAPSSSLPLAYKSDATHFAPIIVSPEPKPGRGKKSLPLVKEFANAEEKEAFVAQKMKQLKENLMKGRAPISLVDDVERDAMLEQELGQGQGQKPRVRSAGVARKYPDRGTAQPKSAPLRRRPTPPEEGSLDHNGVMVGAEPSQNKGHSQPRYDSNSEIESTLASNKKSYRETTAKHGAAEVENNESRLSLVGKRDSHVTSGLDEGATHPTRLPLEECLTNGLSLGESNLRHPSPQNANIAAGVRDVLAQKSAANHSKSSDMNPRIPADKVKGHNIDPIVLANKDKRHNRDPEVRADKVKGHNMDHEVRAYNVKGHNQNPEVRADKAKGHDAPDLGNLDQTHPQAVHGYLPSPPIQTMFPDQSSGSPQVPSPIMPMQPGCGFPAMPFPFQVQLQQDPVTGLFNMIPVAPMAFRPPSQGSHSGSVSPLVAPMAPQYATQPAPGQVPQYATQSPPGQVPQYAAQHSGQVPQYATQSISQGRPQYTTQAGDPTTQYAAQSFGQVPQYAPQSAGQVPQYASQSMGQVPQYAMQPGGQVPQYAAQSYGQMPQYALHAGSQIPPYAMPYPAQDATQSLDRRQLRKKTHASSVLPYEAMMTYSRGRANRRRRSQDPPDNDVTESRTGHVPISADRRHERVPPPTGEDLGFASYRESRDPKEAPDIRRYNRPTRRQERPKTFDPADLERQLRRDHIHGQEGSGSRSRSPPTTASRENVSRVKRTKSGSSLDLKSRPVHRLQVFEIYDDSCVDMVTDTTVGSRDGDNGHLDFLRELRLMQKSQQRRSRIANRQESLSKSQPDLNKHNEHFLTRSESSAAQPEVTSRRGPVARRTSSANRRRRHASETHGVGSPETDAGVAMTSPVPSPSWSKDSGVSGINIRGYGDAFLMERLLNHETLRHHQRLERVIRLIREEFAFDGYMENGIEDRALGEFILSLSSLKWETFVGAITEKHCDLFWQEDLLASLYRAINGEKPHRQESTGESTETGEDHHDNRSGEKASSKANLPKAEVKASTAENQDNAHLLGSARDHRTASTASSHSGCDVNDRSGYDIDDSSISVSRSREALVVSEEHLPQDGGTLERKTRGLALSAINIDINSEEELELGLGDPPPKPPRQGSKGSYTRSKSQEDADPCRDAAGRGEDLLNVSDPFTVSEVEHPPASVPMATATSSRFLSKSVQNLHSSDGMAQSGQLEYKILDDSCGINNNSSHPASLLREKLAASRGGDGSRPPEMQGAALSRSVGNLTSCRETSDSPSPPPSTPVPDSASPWRFPQVSSAVYYPADQRARPDVEVQNFITHLSIQSCDQLESKMEETEQQLLLEDKDSKKTFKYYERLIAVVTKGNKATSEHKTLVQKVGDQLLKTEQRMKFLHSARNYLQMLHSNQEGLPGNLLYALSRCPTNETMLLSPCDNPEIQFLPASGLQDAGLRSPGCLIQAGTPIALTSYLFAEDAVPSGFVHQFLFCFRYMTSPLTLLRFLMAKFSSAIQSLSPRSETPQKVKARILFLLRAWLEGFYSVDFRQCPDLVKVLEAFIDEQITPVDSQGRELQSLLNQCKTGRHVDTVCAGALPQVNRNSSRLDKLVRDRQPPKKWESFKAALHLPAKTQTLQPGVRLSREETGVSLSPGACETGGPGGPEGRGASGGLRAATAGAGAKRVECFTLADHSYQTLAEQLTLMDQELFYKTHPVQFLNSKAQGIGAVLANPVITKAQSLNVLNTSWDVRQNSSLFVDCSAGGNIIGLIEHAQSIAFWVSAEVITCSNAKSQVAAISKFICTAKACQELGNFSSCIAIVDGLENVLVRRLAAWKSIPSKLMTVYNELTAVKISLKSDGTYLLRERPIGGAGTIPSVLPFLIHVQLEEIGGFVLANGMIKWSKMRAICDMVDQIRLFQKGGMHLESDPELQEVIRQRIQEFGQQDLHILATQTESGTPKVRISKIQATLRRVKRRLRGKTAEP